MRRGVLAFLILVSVACGKKDGGSDPVPVITPPSAAALTFPTKDEECTAGTVTSTTESSIPFAWEKAANADSYDITIKNLENNTISTQTTTKTGLVVTLLRNTPYSWFIVAKSSKTSATAKSEVWKFYNSGPGATSYTPFPAEIISPDGKQNVTPISGKITIDWNGSDVDNDIVSYDVYLGTSSPPALLKSNITESILNDVAVTANTTYYLKVITRDSKGNTSDSGIFLFKTN